jgi:hypothetical protein
MSRVRIRIALTALLVLGAVSVACHKSARVARDPDVAPVIKDTARVVAPLTDTSVLLLFKDTTVAGVFTAPGQTLKWGLSGQRQSLLATLRKERALWQARKPRDYRFLVRSSCFCPGPRGWLLIEVRSGRPLRAWDRAGKSAPITNWDTFSIDGLYDNLERMADINGEVQIAFDSRWHFPRYVSEVARPGPDMWATIELRGFRPI